MLKAALHKDSIASIRSIVENRNAISNRSGQYIRQLSGYRAFIPAPLPPEPPIRMAGELQGLLSQADRALGRLDGSIQTLPNPELFVMMYVRKEAVLSSQIEGTQSSLQDVLEAQARVFAPRPRASTNEVINYIRAMNAGLDKLNELPVSVRLIREIHHELLRGVRGSHPSLTPGELRRSQNWIGTPGCTIAEANFVPPPPDMVPEALGNLEQFWHGTDNIPLLLKIGIIHAHFETIHPFLDGNGRIGRLLITLLLTEKAILQKPVLYLSHYFRRYQQTYYQLLQSVRDTGDWESWLAFFLRGVNAVSIEATETARRILALREEHRTAVTERLGRAAGNGHRVLDRLYEHPIVSVNNVQEIIGQTYPAANDLVSRLVDANILQEFTGQTRNRAFRYHRYIDLFSDGPMET